MKIIKSLKIWAIILLVAGQGYGQVEHKVILENYTGVELQCQSELLSKANTLLQTISSPQSNLDIVVALVYPLGLYMEKVDGLNAAAKNYIDYRNHKTEDYILYLVKINDEKGNFDIELHHRLTSTQLSSVCQKNLNFILELLRQDLEVAITLNDRLISAGCIIDQSITNFISHIQNECQTDKVQQKVWFEAKEFEIVNLPGFELDYGSGTNRNYDRGTVETHNRNTCGYADYTQGELKCNIGQQGMTDVATFLNNVATEYERRLIITDKFVPAWLLDSIYKKELIYPSCRNLIWVHFSDTGPGGSHELYLRIANKYAPGYDEQHYTMEQLREMYKQSEKHFSDHFKIPWRIRDYKDQILASIPAGYSFGLPLNLATDLEYNLGLWSGVIDEVIEAVDMIHLIILFGHTIIDFNTNYNPTSPWWWGDLFYKSIEKRNIFEAFKEKTNETYSNWKGLYDAGQKFYNILEVEETRMEFFAMVTSIFETIMQKVSGSVSQFADKFIFRYGKYEAGYAHGQIIANIIPIGALVKGAKTGLSVAKSGNNTLKSVIENINQNITKKQADDIVAVVCLKTSDLYKKLGPTLRAWYKNGMPNTVKGKMSGMSDEALAFFENSVTKHPYLKSEWIANPKMFDFAESLQRDWWTKYGLGGLTKRTNGDITPEMQKLIGETEVVTNGIKSKVKQFTLGEGTAGTIGRAFDDEVIKRITNGFKNNNFDDFPINIKTSLQDIKNQGYKLVTNEPLLSFNGQNFKPDILFVKTDVVQGVTITDIKYLEIKYLDDVPFNTGGQASVKAAVKNNGSATVTNTTNANLFDEVAQTGIENTAGNLTITSVEKLSIKVSDLGLIIQ